MAAGLVRRSRGLQRHNPVAIDLHRYDQRSAPIALTAPTALTALTAPIARTALTALTAPIADWSGCRSVRRRRGGHRNAGADPPPF